MKLKNRYKVLIICLIFLVSGCSTTRNLPTEELLYTGIKDIEVKDDTPKEDKQATKNIDAAVSDAQSALSCPPNGAILGSSSIKLPFLFGLRAYNAFANKEGKFNEWAFKSFASKPIFISTVNPDLRSRIATEILKENGYLDGAVDYEIDTNKNNLRKAKLSYRIEPGVPFLIDSIEYVSVCTGIDSIVRSRASRSFLKIGDNFNLTNMQKERERVSSILRNDGYYYYRPDNISYLADTTQIRNRVSLRVDQKDGLSPLVLQPWKIGNISVNLNGYNNETPTDSIKYKNLTIHYEGKLRVRPSVLYNRIYTHPGDLYSQTSEEKTQSALYGVGIFKYSEMQFTPQDSLGKKDTLNLKINTTYELPLDGELELNVTAKSNNNIGPGIVFGLTKKNIFGGGESLGLKLRGSYEWQTGKRVSGPTAAINSYEISAIATLALPKGLFNKKYMNKYSSTSSYRLYVSQLNRARFFKILSFGGDISSDIQTSATSRHTITPFKLTFNLLQHRTEEFDSIMNVNTPLRKSLEDQFVPSVGYTYTYDDSPIKSKKNHIWAQFSMTEAGLLTNSIYSATGKGFNMKEKRLFGNPYAQFIKGTAELRYNHSIGKKQNLVFRVMAGAAYSYGNAVTTPYNEQFYIGGANSIRAFTIRSIGPGSYRPDPNNTYSYIDQTGDLKFEANVEYRFPILGDLHGAIFLDCGNIWLIRDDHNRPGGQLKMKNFFNQLALGTGGGLRYVLPFLVVRFDTGVGLHVPFQTEKRGYYNIPSFNDALGFHFAIGYPF